MDGITGKRALVTGGSAGIGLAIAKKLSENGATVYIIGRSKEKLDKAVEASGKKLIPLQCDISDWSKTRKIVESILPIELLVNNAGTVCLASVLETTEEQYNKTMNLNLKAAINLTQFVANDLINRKLGGRVVNISSQASGRANVNGAIYSASKAALDMATKCFALELGPHNIRVNSVNPTLVWTELSKTVFTDPKKTSKFTSRIPLGRCAEVDEIANPTIFLLSDKSKLITGHCLWVDGGYSLT